MIFTHKDARDFALTVLERCDTSRIAKPTIDGQKEYDDRRGALFFQTDKGREDCEFSGDYSPGNQRTVVSYTLPVEPAKLRRDIIVHYDTAAFREM